MRDPYKVLGVSKSATSDEIRKEYRNLARKFHPDLNSDPAASDRFKEVNQAYGLIGEEDKRKLWDEFGELSTKPGFNAEQARAYSNMGGGYGGGANINMDDLLGSMFGGGFGGGFSGGPGGPQGGGGRRGFVQGGDDVRVRLSVKLATVLAQESTTVNYLRPEPNGNVVSDTAKVRVPLGTPEGGELRVRGKGGAGHPPGDLLLEVHYDLPEGVRAEGTDLVMDLPITILEAVRGGSIEVPTPDGPVRLKAPPGVTGGQRLRIKDRGLPGKGGRGHLYVVLRPTLPKGDAPELLAAAEQLEALYAGHVREGVGF